MAQCRLAKQSKALISSILQSLNVSVLYYLLRAFRHSMLIVGLSRFLVSSHVISVLFPAQASAFGKGSSDASEELSYSSSEPRLAWLPLHCKLGFVLDRFPVKKQFKCIIGLQFALR